MAISKRLAGIGVPSKWLTFPFAVLRRAEDAYVDELFGAAPAHGATLIGALFPRSYIDVNRAPDDVDPAMLSGTLPPYLVPRPVTRVGLP